MAWACGLAMGAGALTDNSFLTHLATGRLIRETGAPHRDVFTFASEGGEVVVQSWLASWIYATLEDLGGPFAIRLFISVVVGVLMATMWRLSRPAGAIVARLGLTSMAGLVGLLWWNERPQVLAFACFALAALVVAERRSPAWLALIFAIWVNVHGSFPLGIAYVAAALVIAAVERHRDGGAPVERRDLAALVAMAGGTVAGAVVSPYGVDLLTFPVRLLGRSGALQLIEEWRPLSLEDPNSVVFLGAAVAIMALLVLRREWLRLCTAVVFVGMALSAVRNGAIAALVLVPLAAPALAGMGTPDVAGAPPRRRTLQLGAAILAAVAVLVAVTPDEDLDAYPTAAVAWMEAEGWVGRSDDGNARVLTHDYAGAYLEYRYGRDARPWIDDRVELHSFETIRDYVALLSGLGDTDELLARHPHDVVLWLRSSKLAPHLARSEHYVVQYHDDAWVIACRVDSGRC